jgi:ADP-ribose pyrophosphatase
MAGIAPEETVRSEVVYRGRLITVRRDTVRLRSGKTGEREIVEHAPVVAMIPLDEDGKLLMVRQYRKAVEQVLLELPAGSIEEGETPEDAVRREMVEETGYEPRIIRLVTDLYPSPGISDEVMHMYLVSDMTGEGHPTEPADEIEVERVDVTQAAEMVRHGLITDAKSKVGILMLESGRLHNEELGGD